MKLYIVSYGDGKQKGQGIYSLMTENGKELYSIYSQNYVFAYCEFMQEYCNELRDRYINYQILFLGQDNTTLEDLEQRHKRYCKRR